MVETRRGLEMIIEGASTLFDFKSMQRLAEGVLTQLASLINVECGGILVLRDGAKEHEKFSILAGSGCYRHFAGTTGAAALDPALLRGGQRRIRSATRTNSIRSCRCSTSAPAAGARSWCCWKRSGR